MLGFRTPPGREVSFHADEEKTRSAYLAPGRRHARRHRLRRRRTASSTSPTASRTWCCPAASTSTRPRARRCSSSTPPSPRSPSSACPTRDLGEALRALVVPAGDAADLDELTAFCRERLAPTSARRPTSWLTRCRATPWASSTSARCAAPTGTATAPSRADREDPSPGRPHDRAPAHPPRPARVRRARPPACRPRASSRPAGSAAGSRARASTCSSPARCAARWRPGRSSPSRSAARSTPPSTTCGSGTPTCRRSRTWRSRRWAPWTPARSRSPRAGTRTSCPQLDGDAFRARVAGAIDEVFDALAGRPGRRGVPRRDAQRRHRRRARRPGAVLGEPRATPRCPGCGACPAAGSVVAVGQRDGAPARHAGLTRQEPSRRLRVIYTTPRRLA